MPAPCYSSRKNQKKDDSWRMYVVYLFSLSRMTLIMWSSKFGCISGKMTSMTHWNYLCNGKVDQRRKLLGNLMPLSRLLFHFFRLKTSQSFKRRVMIRFILPMEGGSRIENTFFICFVSYLICFLYSPFLLGREYFVFIIVVILRSLVFL